MSKVWEFVAAVFAVMVGVILVLLILQLTQGDQVDHTDLDLRLAGIERAVIYNGCIIMADGDPVAMAECQIVDPLTWEP